MTREEALQHFKEQLDIFGGEHAEAIKVAIEALEQVTGKLNNPEDSLLTADPEACKEQKSKLDLISRAEAIEAMGEEPPVWCDEEYEIAERNQWRDDVEAIKSVPSAEAVPQSEQYKKGFEDAKRAFLVEYARESQNMRKRIAQLEVRLNAQKAISADRPTDSDLISRAEAAEIFEAMLKAVTDQKIKIGISRSWQQIKDLPSADRPRGEWVYHEDYKLDGECCYECSECGRMYDYKMNYCGYCGADMRPTGRSEE